MIGQATAALEPAPRRCGPGSWALALAAWRPAWPVVGVDELLRRIRRWLAPGGLLFLLGPRREGDAPFVAGLPRPALDYALDAHFHQGGAAAFAWLLVARAPRVDGHQGAA